MGRNHIGPWQLSLELVRCWWLKFWPWNAPVHFVSCDMDGCWMGSILLLQLAAILVGQLRMLNTYKHYSLPSLKFEPGSFWTQVVHKGRERLYFPLCLRGLIWWVTLVWSYRGNIKRAAVIIVLGSMSLLHSFLGSLPGHQIGFCQTGTLNTVLKRRLPCIYIVRMEWSWLIEGWSRRPTGFLQCFNVVGCIIWHVKLPPKWTIMCLYSLNHSPHGYFLLGAASCNVSLSLRCWCGRTHDSNLWVLALSYFAQKEENCKQQLLDVLNHILSMFSCVCPVTVHWCTGNVCSPNQTSCWTLVRDYECGHTRLPLPACKELNVGQWYSEMSFKYFVKIHFENWGCANLSEGFILADVDGDSCAVGKMLLACVFAFIADISTSQLTWLFAAKLWSCFVQKQLQHYSLCFTAVL